MWSNGAYSSWNSYYQLKVLALLKLFWILLYSSFIKQGTSQTFLDPGPAYLLITTNWKVLGSGQNNQNNKMVYGALNVQAVTCTCQSPASLQCGHWALSPPPALCTLLGGLDCWQYDGFPFGGCWSQAQSPTQIPKGKLIDHLDFGQRVLKPCKIKCPFFLRKRFNNICLLILLGIKRTILFHALHQSKDKGCHVLFQIPTHDNSPTNTRGRMKISVLARDKFYHEIYFASYFIRNVCKFVSSLK